MNKYNKDYNELIGYINSDGEFIDIDKISSTNNIFEVGVDLLDLLVNSLVEFDKNIQNPF